MYHNVQPIQRSRLVSLRGLGEMYDTSGDVSYDPSLDYSSSDAIDQNSYVPDTSGYTPIVDTYNGDSSTLDLSNGTPRDSGYQPTVPTSTPTATQTPFDWGSFATKTTSVATSLANAWNTYNQSVASGKTPAQASAAATQVALSTPAGTTALKTAAAQQAATNPAGGSSSSMMMIAGGLLAALLLMGKKR